MTIILKECKKCGKRNCKKHNPHQMTNLNTDLIEKVKKDNISIFVGKNGDRDLLIKLLTHIYPHQTPPTSCNWEYYQNDDGRWVSLSHTSREAIPLSAFFIEPNLTSEDNAKLSTQEQALISDMNERLKRLEVIIADRMSPCIAEEIVQPIDTTEGDYVRCTFWNGELYTDGEIYHVVNGMIINNSGFNDDYADLITHQPFFEPATHAEFLAQEQGKEWKEGMWFKTGVGRLYLIVELNGHNFKADNQDFDVFNATSLDFIYPATPEEIQAHLVAIARKKYPVGATFINLYSNVRQIVANHKYTHYKNGELRVNGGLVWHNGKWAELAPIETEQRWENKDFTFKTFVQHDSFDGYSVLITVNTQSKETAYKKLDAIKQYLSTNKF
jgi:hypothetical protein